MEFDTAALQTLKLDSESPCLWFAREPDGQHMTSVGKCSCAQMNSTWLGLNTRSRGQTSLEVFKRSHLSTTNSNTKQSISVIGVQEKIPGTLRRNAGFAVWLESFNTWRMLAEGEHVVQSVQWLRVRVRLEELVHSEENLSYASLCMTHQSRKRFQQSRMSSCDAQLR